jgi:predicted O-linked N-acetylglucosamine transferase (SPINDLY family)
LIANSVEEYVQIALALACNPGRLDELRRSLRPRMAASPLCDGRAFARKPLFAPCGSIGVRIVWE